MKLRFCPDVLSLHIKLSRENKKNKNRNGWLVSFIITSALILPLSAHSATSSQELSQIPEGFRDLAGPQMTVADFYYGDRYFTSTNIIYTPNTVTILDPYSLIQRIRNVSDFNSVVTALTGELSANPEMVCSVQGQQNCGRLNPEVAGVIFNEGRFRVDLFIAEPYLTTQLMDQSKYLPESSSGLGLIQGISSAASGVAGTGDSRTSYSLFGNTLAGWRENHLVTNWDVATEQNFSVSTLFLGRDADGWQLGAGYLNQAGLMTTNFASSEAVLGLRMGSSMNTRLDMANVNATPVSIFANGRRRVEVFRDDRLIYATNVEAGSQEINTRSFPQGAYNITVRIYDGAVLTQEFTRFFSKSVRIPPANETLWYLEGGEPTRRVINEVLPEGTGQWMVRGGLARRLLDNVGVELRGVANDGDYLGETEFYFQGDGWDFTLTGMAANESAKGLLFNTAVPFGPVYINYSHRRLWNKNYQSNTDENNRLLGESYENRSVSLSMELFGGNFSSSYSYNMRDSRNKPEEIYSFGWSKNIMRLAGHDLNLQMRYSQRDGSKIGNLNLTLRRSSQGWNYSARSQNRWNKNDGTPTTRHSGYSLDSNWYSDDVLNGTGQVGLRYDDLSDDNKTLGGNIQYEQSRFLADANVDYVNSAQSDNYVNYTGRLDTSFAINTNSAAIGGGRISDSAVIIDIEGSEQAIFDVLVNGGATGVARGGAKTALPLSPYGTYGISIRPRGMAFYDYDQGERMVVLYPGNVETVSYQSQEELLLLGKLVDLQGHALEFANILTETAFGMTDQYGIFQLRIPVSEEYLTITKENNELCTIRIPENYEKRAGVGLVGELRCKLD